MNKSEFGQASSRHAVVGASDVGKEVIVIGIGRGILRYIGGVSGREGLFCGVELDAPDGKHDGTYQGFQYFTCRPQHGIFAPLYKVELAVSPEMHMSNSSTFTRENSERLSRSALPALQLKSVCRPADPPVSVVAQDSARSRSVSRESRGTYRIEGSLDGSTTSSLMDNSLRLPMEEEEDLLTMVIPKGKTLLKHLASEPDHSLCASMTLPESRVGVENLPVIEDEETEATPLVEKRPPIGNFPPNPMMSGYHVDLHGRDYLNGGGYAGHAEDMDFSSHTFDIVHEDREMFSDEESEPQCSGSEHDGHSTMESPQEGEKVPTPPNPTTTTTNEMDTAGAPAGKSKPVPKMTAAALKRLEAAKKIEKEPKEAKTKKASTPDDACMPQPSVRELQNAPTQPKFPVKPKAPSKHQLMMEQIKASIEAEKVRPKKERKERISLLPPPPAPPKQEKTDENVPTDPVMNSASKVSTPTRAGPLKQVNAASEKPSAVAKPAREPRKPRQSLLPPVPTAAVAKARKDESPRISTASKKMGSQVSVASTASCNKVSPRPASARLSTVSKSASPATTARRPAVGRKTIEECEKVQRLQSAVRGMKVLSVLYRWIHDQKEALRENAHRTSEECDRRARQNEELRQRLTAIEQEYRARAEETSARIEQLTRAHERNIEATKKAYDKQIEEKSHEHEKAVEEERARHEAEVAAITRRHQSVCAQLDEKIVEAEQSAESLRRDKHSLQTALANDIDTKVQMLTAEISSLQTALSLKSQEMKELRQHNQALTMQIEEIPSLQLEIAKLKHKVNDLKQMLDQKRNVEKALVQQNEELKKTAHHISQMNQSIIQGMDVLRYQMEEKGESVDPASFQTPPSSKVAFRSRPTSSGDRTSWTLPGRLSSSAFPELPSQFAEDALCRSTVSMYATHRLSGVSGTDEDVIYAPDEVLSSSHGSARRKNSLSSSESDQDTKKRVRSAQTDSGIGL